jgi:hypothetical protein
MLGKREDAQAPTGGAPVPVSDAVNNDDLPF